MSDAKNTYTVEQIIECINHVPLEDIRVHCYDATSVDVVLNYSRYKITKCLRVSAYRRYYDNDAVVLKMCLLTAANCLFK